MPSITLTDPVAGTTVASGLIATNNANLRNLLNSGLDAANFLGNPGLVANETAVWNGTSFIRSSAAGLNIGGPIFLGGDVKLIRNTAGQLSIGDGTSPGSLLLAPSNLAAIGFAIDSGFNGPNNYFQIRGDGRLEWGAAGANAVDANLYRNGAAVLKTDSNFVGAGWIALGNAASNPNNGSLALGTAATPGTVTTGGVLYVDSADNKLKYKGSSGTVTTIALP